MNRIYTHILSRIIKTATVAYTTVIILDLHHELILCHNIHASSVTSFPTGWPHSPCVTENCKSQFVWLT